ncbi:hypothetical protein QMA04_07510 [Planococcus sp. APC 3900]|uniref:hypothetical protein n=1 Tax=Planococcus sp. APC 3900 TaxID=3035191 RepID=UPI0025B494BF|nr:hypothetical protein [Planococcus sp. APC 3900]MDN3437935.1 hypothetical protein [Planococcus sp. APC 3900]
MGRILKYLLNFIAGMIVYWTITTLWIYWKRKTDETCSGIIRIFTINYTFKERLSGESRRLLDGAKAT